MYPKIEVWLLFLFNNFRANPVRAEFYMVSCKIQHVMEIFFMSIK